MQAVYFNVNDIKRHHITIFIEVITCLQAAVSHLINCLFILIAFTNNKLYRCNLLVDVRNDK